jgi:ribosomal protein S18 acetylase RimI-like enzyme
MQLGWRRFQADDYPTYAAWFDDPELNCQLGPLDEEWLETVLIEPPADGATWAVLRDHEVVAVVEVAYDRQHPATAAIMALAVKPALRGQGIGAAVLRDVLARHRRAGITEHRALIAATNLAAQRLVAKAGFQRIAAEPDAYGMLQFRHRL